MHEYDAIQNLETKKKKKKKKNTKPKNNGHKG